MKVGLVSLGDARDVREWSGIPFHVHRALTDLGVEVALVSPLGLPRPRLAYGRWRMAQAMGRSYRPEFESSSVRAFAAQARKLLDGTPVDVVLSLSTLPLGRLDTGVPTGVWLDATFTLLQQTYSEFEHLSMRQRRTGHRHEAAGLVAADMVFCASRWAQASVVDDFGIPGDRVAVAPFGANLDRPFDDAQVERAIAARTGAPLRLVFIGADWERKQGALAVQVADTLHARGLAVRLRMFGAAPPAGEALPPFVTIEGFTRKDTADGRTRLEEALLEADVLVMPSRAECFGIAVSEASAAGVPCVGAAVGGLTDAIAEGRNGRLLPADAGSEQYADAILDLTEDRGAYAELARTSRTEFAMRLNWTTSVSQILEALVARAGARA